MRFDFLWTQAAASPRVRASALSGATHQVPTSLVAQIGRAARLVTAVLVLSASTVLGSASAWAQTTKAIEDNYEERIEGVRTIAQSGPDLFGDSVNLKDGKTSFNVTDISIPTNSGLPVSLSRTLAVNARDMDKYVDGAANGELLGNWRLDLPVMFGTFDERTGWVSGGANPQMRCSVTSLQGAAPPPVKGLVDGWNTYYFAEEYWSGNQVRIPGQGEYPLLLLQAGTPNPADGKTYYWTTKGQWRISCLPAMKNATGEGFLVALPDGTKYTFDWMSSRQASALQGSNCVSTRLYSELMGDRGYPMMRADGTPIADIRAEFGRPPMEFEGGGPSIGGCAFSTQVVVKRREYFIHATKVEDRFGNWVAYAYDPVNPRRLLSVTSSDGARINLSYGAHGKIVSATANARSWQYRYNNAAAENLVQVMQPDASHWDYQYGDLYTLLHYNNQRILWPDCEPSVPGQASADVSITHPSGAKGVFTFRSMMHGTDRVPGGCSLPNPERPLRVDLSPIPMVYKAASLVAKEISGAGAATQRWSYTYSPNWSWNPSGYVDDCSAGTVCDAVTQTEVLAPDQTTTRWTFGNDYFRSAGQLLKVEKLRGGAVVDSSESVYVPSASGRAFPDKAGLDPNWRNNHFSTAKLRPLLRNTKRRDGDTYVTENNEFDASARPRVVTRSNSLGYRKQETVDYHDNVTLWVLNGIGQVAVRALDVNGGGQERPVATSSIEFNALALPQRKFAFGKLKETFTYHPDGTIASVSDGRGNRTDVSGWKRGVAQLIRFPATPESPAGATMSAVVNDDGWLTSVTNEAGVTAGYGYDAMGRLANIVEPGGDGVSYHNTQRDFRPVADADWKPVNVVAGQWRLWEATGNRVRLTYMDALWRPVLIHEYDAANVAQSLRAIRSGYDINGHVNFVSYPSSEVNPPSLGTRTIYDDLGRVVRIEQDADSAVLVTRTEYLSGLTTRVTNPRGAQTTTRFMAWDEPGYDFPVQTAQPEGKFVDIARHPQFGWPLSMTQHDLSHTLAQTRRYVYDGNAQLCKTIEPETGVRVMGYDAAGNLTWAASGLSGAAYGVTNDCQHAAAYAAGRTSERTFDARNRLQSLAFPDGRGNQTWTYTPDSLTASVSVFNEAGAAGQATTSYTYNRRRLLVGETLRQDNWYVWSLQYGYDAYGSVSSQTYPTGLRIDYAPDVFGRPTLARDQGGKLYASAITYYPNGALRQFTYGNGVVRSMLQNTRQLPSRITHSGVSDQTYDYDANGNLAQIRDLVRGDNYNRTMQYDNLDRLTAAGSASFGGDAWHRFSYDVLDNIKSWTLAGVKDYSNYVYDSATNRLTSIRNSAGSAVVNMSYDVQGNLIAKDGQSYDFDFGNRLRNVPGKESYRYDGLGRRVQTTTTSGKTTLWMYDTDGRMLFSSDWQGAYQNQRTHEHIYLSGTQIASIDHEWPSNTVLAVKYHHTDALGSPVAVSNASASVTERNDYEPFGAVIGKPAFAGIGYTGHVMDGSTGFTYMQQRYYDAQIGRFLSADPVGASPSGGDNFNRYWYASNNPYKYVDPDGRHPALVAIIFIGKGAVGASVEYALQRVVEGKSHDEVEWGWVAFAGGIDMVGLPGGSRVLKTSARYLYTYFKGRQAVATSWRISTLIIEMKKLLPAARGEARVAVERSIESLESLRDASMTLTTVYDDIAKAALKDVAAETVKASAVREGIQQAKKIEEGEAQTPAEIVINAIKNTIKAIAE
ncbi:MAG: RHS repeat-associated core domain-containing protein [Rhodanobacteraceae bacterium]|nr:RHS repeat-associated core domain-containing protein [Rhodanobacteraceae bacterium]